MGRGDKTGAWAIPAQFENGWHFNQGLAAAQTNGKWGSIDKTASRCDEVRVAGSLLKRSDDPESPEHGYDYEKNEQANARTVDDSVGAILPVRDDNQKRQHKDDDQNQPQHFASPSRVTSMTRGE